MESENQTWRTQFCCRNAALRLQERASLIGARNAFARQAYNGVNCLLRFHEIPNDYHVDAVVYYTFGEVHYIQRHEEVTASLLVRWRQCIPNLSAGVVIADQAIMFDRKQLIAEFRYSRKTGEYWSYIKDKRRFRSLYEQIVPYQWPTHLHKKKLSRERDLAKIDRLLRRKDVSRGCYVDLPPAFSYVCSEMAEDDNGGWWAVAFTEFICKTYSFILEDVSNH